MSKYQIEFYGRLKGAIGILYTITEVDKMARIARAAIAKATGG